MAGCHKPSLQAIDRDFKHVFGIALPQTKTIQISYVTFGDSHGDYALYAVASLSDKDFENMQLAFDAFRTIDTQSFSNDYYPEIVQYFRRASKAFECSVPSCLGKCAFLPATKQIAFTIEYQCCPTRT